MKKENIIVTKSFDFALAIIDLYKKMAEQKEFVLSKQQINTLTAIVKTSQNNV